MGYLLKSKEIPLCDSYEVIVVGGGPAGCAAAIAAARKGAKTLLIEATGCLGGRGTIGLFPQWAPFSDMEKIIYRGIAEEIFFESYHHLKHGEKNKFDEIPIDPERLKTVYDEKVLASGADVLFHTMVSNADADNGEVQAIIVSNQKGLSAYRAKVYIDCTDDANLAAWSGAEILETKDVEDYQPATLCFEITNVDMEEYYSEKIAHEGDPNSLIYTISQSKSYSIPDAHMHHNEVYPGTVGFNAGHLWNVDSTDPWSISKAMIKGRRLAHELHRALLECYPKAFGASFLCSTAGVMGIRESRRIKGDYILSKKDYLSRRSFADEICRNAYFLDVHRFEPKNGKTDRSKEKKDKRIGKYGSGESYGIPYRCLTPSNLTNVLVAGSCISTEREVQGSTRVMPVCLCMGEAAGKAAVIAKNMQKIDVHKIDINLLRQQIIEDGGYIHSDSHQKESVKMAKEYIAQYFDQKISIPDIAGFCFVNPIYLSRVFKQETGMTIHTYLQEYRIGIAKKYLLQNKGIEETAIACGYSGAKYFSTCFKKVVGESPVQFKKSHSHRLT